MAPLSAKDYLPNGDSGRGGKMLIGTTRSQVMRRSWASARLEFWTTRPHLNGKKLLEGEIKLLQDEIKIEKRRTDLEEKINELRKEIEEEKSRRREWVIRRAELDLQIDELRKGPPLQAGSARQRSLRYMKGILFPEVERLVPGSKLGELWARNS